MTTTKGRQAADTMDALDRKLEKIVRRMVKDGSLGLMVKAEVKRAMSSTTAK